MYAGEIRRLAGIDELEKIEVVAPGQDIPRDIEGVVLLLGEIAAQLAELNDNIESLRKKAS